MKHGEYVVPGTKAEPAKLVRCVLCSRPLTYIKGQKGGHVPLDLTTIRYDTGDKAYVAMNHFATCQRWKDRIRDPRAENPEAEPTSVG